jgi:hypothetical protein
MPIRVLRRLDQNLIRPKASRTQSKVQRGACLENGEFPVLALPPELMPKSESMLPLKTST